MSFIKCTIIGFLGADPEQRFIPSGTSVSKFRMAVNDKRKGQNGETQDAPLWVTVEAWGRLSELAQQYLTKGQQCYIEGRLRQDEWTDRDGNKRSTLIVTASDIQFLGRKENGEGNQPDSKPAARSAAFEAQKPVKQELDDKGIPF